VALPASLQAGRKGRQHDPGLSSDEVVLVWLCSATGLVPKVRAVKGKAVPAQSLNPRSVFQFLAA
jgi:hypothetical protein